MGEIFADWADLGGFNVGKEEYFSHGLHGFSRIRRHTDLGQGAIMARGLRG